VLPVATRRYAVATDVSPWKDAPPTVQSREATAGIAAQCNAPELQRKVKRCEIKTWGRRRRLHRVTNRHGRLVFRSHEFFSRPCVSEINERKSRVNLTNHNDLWTLTLVRPNSTNFLLRSSRHNNRCDRTIQKSSPPGLSLWRFLYEPRQYESGVSQLIQVSLDWRSMFMGNQHYTSTRS